MISSAMMIVVDSAVVDGGSSKGAVLWCGLE